MIEFEIKLKFEMHRENLHAFKFNSQIHFGLSFVGAAATVSLFSFLIERYNDFASIAVIKQNKA